MKECCESEIKRTPFQKKLKRIIAGVAILALVVFLIIQLLK